MNDKFYEHPVDRVRELGQLSQFHKRDEFGVIQKNQTSIYENNQLNSQNYQIVQDHGIGNVPKRKSIQEKIRNLFFQQYSFLYILVGSFWIAMMVLFCLEVNQPHYQDGKIIAHKRINQLQANSFLYTNSENDHKKNITINMKESQLKILDEKFSHDYSDPFRIEYECFSNEQIDLEQNNIFSNCLITLYVNQNYLTRNQTFSQIQVNCIGHDKCVFYLQSNYLTSERLILNGYNLQVRANQIITGELAYNSHLGSFYVQDLQSYNSSHINTFRGDVVIETRQNILLNTYTIDKFICATAPLMVSADDLQNYYQILSLDKQFVELNETDCIGSLFQHSKQTVSNDLKKQIQHQHSNNQKSSKQFSQQQFDGEYPDQNELKRCTALRNVLLLNSISQQSIQELQQAQNITISSSEGNIFINVIDSYNIYAPPIMNSLYLNNTMNLSESSLSFLDSQLKDKKPKDVSHLIINLYFDGRTGLFNETNKISTSYNFEYLFIPPWWVSTLTFNTLNYEVLNYDLLFTPAKCPYYLSKEIQEYTYKNFTTGQYPYLKENYTYNNYSYGYSLFHNSSYEQTQFYESVYKLVYNQLYSYGIDDISIRYEGKTYQNEDIIYTVMIAFGVTILILSAIGSVAMHIYFYRLIEKHRNQLKMNAFEMWIYMTMNLFGKYKAQDAPLQNLNQQDNNNLMVQQQSLQYSQHNQLNSQYQYTQNLYQSEVNTLLISYQYYFDQTFILITRVMNNSILMNYNEIKKEDQQNDIGPLLINLISQPINVLFNNDISRYIPLTVNYCILCVDQQVIQDLIKQIAIVNEYLISNQQTPSDDKIIEFIYKIQQLINEFQPTFNHKVFQIFAEQKINIENNHGQLKLALLNQSMGFLKCYLQGYKGKLAGRIVNSEDQEQLTLEANSLDAMLDQFSQFYIKCKQICPQIFDQIEINDQQKVSVYLETIHENMKTLNVYTRVTKELQKLKSEFVISGFLVNFKMINILFDSIVYSQYSSNFVNLLYELWQYMSIINISNQYDTTLIQNIVYLKSSKYQQQQAKAFSLRQTQKYGSNQFYQSNLFQSSSNFGQANQINAQIYDQDPRNINPKVLSIIQKYEYYPTFANWVNFIQRQVQTKKSTIECFCELLFAKIPKLDSKKRINPAEYCDDLTFQKFKEYYAIYCYALYCKEEVVTPNQELNSILQKYMYALDGDYLRAYSATGRYKIYIGLMENLFYVINMAPKVSYEAILDNNFSENLIKYKHYLIKHSYKLNKVNAFTIIEQIIQYLYILFLLNLPILLCAPIIFAQYAYSNAYFQYQYSQNIYYQQNFHSFFTIFCSSGLPYTVFAITFTFIFICATDALVYFIKPRLDKNNYYLSYFKLTFQEFLPDFSLIQSNKDNIQQNSLFVAEDKRFSSSGLNMSQQNLINGLYKNQNQNYAGVDEVDKHKISQAPYSNRTFGFYFRLSYQVAFKVLLWSLIAFNTFFFFLTLFILTISSFVYLEQGLLFAIFLITLIGVLFLRQRNLLFTHKKTKEQLAHSWERLLVCNITQQYAFNISLSPQLIENFLRDKNLDEKYYRRDKLIAYVKSLAYYDNSQGVIYRYMHPEKIVVSQNQFIQIIQYMVKRGTKRCLKLLNISTTDIISELAWQTIIQFSVFLICSMIVDYFNLCKNGVQLLFNAIVTIVIAIAIFSFLDKKHSYINAQSLDNAVNYVSRIECRAGITIFTQNIDIQQI
ncbi:transmembrane protein, putative (macronuclear) [Tetrahymena thermophila SB210]|uniref:Transmembrane protein, putative n=1 Tax=Tetrahymena thermophila (strain SB210) TaxID=312017 RepID=Q22Y57_TETTS|nr:transmembrane protein, putative [Tetrahymena thermophila SB210]EAR90167.2 transmembrane protein, putative [Tetrahymena thermophila SB210]|eukprot:XP_001010412.2 transmembrane protein, putative [Tetrahymena thermophila SB210]